MIITSSLTVILNQVDKYFHREQVDNYKKKNVSTASNFFWDSQLGLIIMRST